MGFYSDKDGMAKAEVLSEDDFFVVLRLLPCMIASTTATIIIRKDDIYERDGDEFYMKSTATVKIVS